MWKFFECKLYTWKFSGVKYPRTAVACTQIFLHLYDYSSFVPTIQKMVVSYKHRSQPLWNKHGVNKLFICSSKATPWTQTCDNSPVYHAHTHTCKHLFLSVSFCFTKYGNQICFTKYGKQIETGTSYTWKNRATELVCHPFAEFEVTEFLTP